MKANRTLVSSFVASLVLGAALVGASAPALSHWGGGGPGFFAQDEAGQQRMRERSKARLERMAARLEIKASQQEAWAAYTKVFESFPDTALKRPAADADAATVMRFRADLAAERAQKLAQIADATARLQQALTPEQRKVLDEIARHPGRHGGHRHGH